MAKFRSSRPIRLIAPLLALCFTGAALAAPKDGTGSVAYAICYGNANQQYYIELAQCANDPYRYSDCRDQAQLHYAVALDECRAKAAVVIGGSGEGLKASPPRPLGALGPAGTGAGRGAITGSRPEVFVAGAVHNHRR